MTMFLSLIKTGTKYPLYVMLPHTLMVSEESSIERLKNCGLYVLDYSHSILTPRFIENNEQQGFGRFNHTFDKLLVFGLTQFDKIVFVDADMYVLQNLDHLFEYPHMSAVVAGQSYPGNQAWVDLNSGLMVIKPQEGLVQELQQILPEIHKHREVFGDQDVLQLYYSDWPKQQEKNLGEKYNVFSQYASYYETVLGYCYTNEIDNSKSIAVVHFIGEQKPWMRQWNFFSVLKQELQLAMLRLIHKRNTSAVLLEYKHLIRQARKLL